MDFAVPTDHRIKLKESEKKDIYLNLARELKKNQTMEHEGDDDTNSNWGIWKNLQRIDKGTGRLRN